MANRTLTQFPVGSMHYRINFEYLARPFVVVTLVNSADKSKNRVLVVGNDYRFESANTIQMLADTTGFNLVQIHRYTQTELVVDFRDGSVLTARDLTNSELQAIHIAEEGRDQTLDLAKDYAEAAESSSNAAKDVLNKVTAWGLNSFKPVGSFEAGGTVRQQYETLQYGTGTNVTHWRWEGSLPKTVGQNSSPQTTGGIGKGLWVDATDSTLRGQLSDVNGASKYPALHMARWRDEGDVRGFDAVGDGVNNDSPALNGAAQSSSSEIRLQKGKKYVGDNHSNPLGKPYTGLGVVVKKTSQGLEMQNSYTDAYQRMTGQENLAAWFKELMQPTGAAPKILFSGDSTTAGDGTSAKFKINLLTARGIKNRGLQTVYGINAVNHGHSGASTAAWLANYVDEDIAENAPLYVVRWGINDVKEINSFANNLRTGLAKYRAAHPFETHSILLMTPNSTYDVPNNRDAKWYEQLYYVYLQAARDFKCAFIDTYALTQNSKGLAGILMDNPYGDGRGIHPNDTLNSIISGYIVDMVAPMGLTTVYGRTRITATAGGEDASRTANDAPAEYSELMAMIRTLPANGWPLDGNALTFRSMDGTLIQNHWGYKDKDRGSLYVRYGRASALGGETATWSPFYQLPNRFKSVDINVEGVYQTGNARVSRTGTTVVIDGNLTLSTPSTVGVGAVIGTVQGGYRPTRGMMFGTATLYNGTTFTQVPVNIQTTGKISVAGSGTGITAIYLSITYDIEG